MIATYQYSLATSLFHTGALMSKIADNNVDEKGGSGASRLLLNSLILSIMRLWLVFR